VCWALRPCKPFHEVQSLKYLQSTTALMLLRGCHILTSPSSLDLVYPLRAAYSWARMSGSARGCWPGDRCPGGNSACLTAQQPWRQGCTMQSTSERYHELVRWYRHKAPCIRGFRNLPIFSLHVLTSPHSPAHTYLHLWRYSLSVALR